MMDFLDLLIDDQRLKRQTYNDIITIKDNTIEDIKLKLDETLNILKY